LGFRRGPAYPKDRGPASAKRTCASLTLVVHLDAFIACASPAARLFVWIKSKIRFAEQ
jgi:hypothetical protein